MTSSLWWSPCLILVSVETDMGHHSHLLVLLTSWNPRVLTTLLHTPLASLSFTVLFLSWILTLTEVSFPHHLCLLDGCCSSVSGVKEHLSWLFSPLNLTLRKSFVLPGNLHFSLYLFTTSSTYDNNFLTSPSISLSYLLRHLHIQFLPAATSSQAEMNHLTVLMYSTITANFILNWLGFIVMGNPDICWKFWQYWGSSLNGRFPGTCGALGSIPTHSLEGEEGMRTRTQTCPWPQIQAQTRNYPSATLLWVNPPFYLHGDSLSSIQRILGRWRVLAFIFLLLIWDSMLLCSPG